MRPAAGVLAGPRSVTSDEHGMGPSGASWRGSQRPCSRPLATISAPPQMARFLPRIAQLFRDAGDKLWEIKPVCWTGGIVKCTPF